jgi:hypothetical protein
MPKRDIGIIWDDVRVWLTDATRTAMKEAEDLTRRGRLKMEMLRLNHDVERARAALGGRVHEHFAAHPDVPFAVTDDVSKLVRQVSRFQAELAAKQKEYEAEKD